MKKYALLLLSALTLASCGQQATPADTASAPSTTAPTGSVAAQIADFAQRPELQDADSQALLRQYANDPLMLENLQRAYGLNTQDLDADQLAAQVSGTSGLSAQATGKAGYAQSVAWGTVSHYRAEKASPNYSGLNWSSNGCSAPSGLGLGYRDTFRPACDVHDFGYGNLPGLTAKWAWPYNKARTDSAFLNNMNAICNGKSWYARPACYAAARAYYEAVSVGGWLHWH